MLSTHKKSKNIKQHNFWNWKFSFDITDIHYILKYINIENTYFKL